MAAAGLIPNPELAPAEESLLTDWLWGSRRAPPNWKITD
jgi:hypothetical protein